MCSLQQSRLRTFVNDPEQPSGEEARLFFALNSFWENELQFPSRLRIFRALRQSFMFRVKRPTMMINSWMVSSNVDIRPSACVTLADAVYVSFFFVLVVSVIPEPVMLCRMLC